MSSPSRESNESDAESINSDCFAYGEDDDDYSCLEQSFIHEKLAEDIEKFKQYCNSEQIYIRRLDGIQETDIDMTLTLDFIKRSVLEAWGLQQDLPIVFRLSLDSKLHFLDYNFKKIDVFQDDNKKFQSGALIQLKNIGTKFFKEKLGLKSRGKTVALSSLFSERVQIEKAKSLGCLSCDSSKTSESNERCREDSSFSTEGFFVELYRYMRQRLETLNDHCPICDLHHGWASMLRPTVCSNPLCMFSSQSLGVMSQVTDMLRTEPQVVDLLVMFTRAAAFSSRHSMVLTPFPVIFDTQTHDLVFSQGEQGEGITLLRRVLSSLATIKLPVLPSESDLKTFLQATHEHLYQLLRWILSTNRSHILYLPKEKQLEMIPTDCQFVMRNSPPSEDVAFRSLARQHGSCYAFHGSPLENWHSIVRRGLIIASGSDMMLHGAAHGRGIYLSPLLERAMTYAGRVRGTLGAQTKLEDQKVCVALCEVVTDQSLEKRHPDVWLVRKREHICTRFFFLLSFYERKKVDSTSPSFVKAIQDILLDI